MNEDVLSKIIKKYHIAIDRFNEENKNKYEMRCFAHFGEMRFYIYFVKLNGDPDKILQATLYIPINDLEKQLRYSVNMIYNGLNKLNKEIYGDRDD